MFAAAIRNIQFLRDPNQRHKGEKGTIPKGTILVTEYDGTSNKTFAKFDDQLVFVTMDVDVQVAWLLFECEGGNRWATTTYDYSLKPCTFTGCECRGKVEKKGHTTIHRGKREQPPPAGFLNAALATPSVTY